MSHRAQFPKVINLKLLIEARKKKGLKQSDLAKSLGIHRKTILNWESGLSEPKVSEWAAWARALGMDLDEALRASLDGEYAT